MIEHLAIEETEDYKSILNDCKVNLNTKLRDLLAR